MFVNIDELKEKFKENKLEKGVFTSTNERNENVIVTVGENGFELKTYQNNGWIRINIYTYNPEGTWGTEELYDK